jgi:hypothetical protein
LGDLMDILGSASLIPSYRGQQCCVTYEMIASPPDLRPRLICVDFNSLSHYRSYSLKRNQSRPSH